MEKAANWNKDIHAAACSSTHVASQTLLGLKRVWLARLKHCQGKVYVVVPQTKQVYVPCSIAVVGCVTHSSNVCKAMPTVGAL